MNLDPSIQLDHPELLHRALEGELLTSELDTWERWRSQPEVATVVSSLEMVAQSLRTLERVHVPPGFSSVLGKRLALEVVPPELESHGAEIALAGLPKLQAPDGFAGRLAASIALDAANTPEVPEVNAVVQSVQGLERIHAPPGFAAQLAFKITAEAGLRPVVGSVVRDAERGPTPLYFLGAILMGALLGALTLGWGEARNVAFATLEAVEALPPSLFVTAGVALLVALLTTSGRLRLGPSLNFAAFAVFAALSVPQIWPLVGSARVVGADHTVLRFGDLSVAGSVQGDAISVGGTLRLEPGARVTGRAVSLLGDLSVQLEAQAANGLSAVGGVVQAGDVPTVVLKENWPGLSAANALKPLRYFLSTSDWQVLYFVLVAAITVMLALLSDRLVGLERGFRGESGRALGLGALLVTGSSALALGFGLSGTLTTLGLLLASLVGVALTVGFAVSLFEFGGWIHALTRRWWPRTMGPRRTSTLEVSLALVVFAATLFWLPLAVAVWLLGGLWGVGAVALEWRSGRLVDEFIQQGAH